MREQETLQAAEEFRLRRERAEEAKKRKLSGLGLVLKKMLYQRGGMVLAALKFHSHRAEGRQQQRKLLQRSAATQLSLVLRPRVREL